MLGIMPGFKKILLVDDDIITITICERLMKIGNFADEVIARSDGQQAREYLLENILSPPEIILLDLHMSIMSGWEFLEWYEKWTASLGSYPPVYVLSSSLSREDSKRSQAYEQVKGYIVKPMTITHLKEITSAFLK
jgi:CheY-like chemotaxis protein